MVHIQRTFTVEQPVEVVVDYLKDFGHAEQWDPGTVSCTRASSGPIEVGTSWDNVSKVRGRETQLSYRLERLERGRITFGRAFCFARLSRFRNFRGDSRSGGLGDRRILNSATGRSPLLGRVR